MEKKHEAWVLATLNWLNAQGVPMGSLEIPDMLVFVGEKIQMAFSELAKARKDLERAMDANRRFPIQGGPSVPWALVAPYEGNAKKNHDQTLDRLAERGGLSSGELWLIVYGHDWRMCPSLEFSNKWLAEWLAEHEGYKAERDAALAELARHKEEKRVKVRGVDFACEECKQLKGSHLENGWYRCNNCGYPGQ